jgi:hydrogenase nickel incorporation protein HypA/HybF
VHEIGIAQEVLRIIEEQARGHGPGAVRSARLSIGALSGVVPESLEFALEVCAKGTRAEGMKIVIRNVPARGICKGCGHEWDFAAGQMECPACRASDIRLDGGDDLRVDSFEMEDEKDK